MPRSGGSNGEAKAGSPGLRPWLAALAVLGLLPGAGCARARQEGPPPPTEVTVVTVTPRDVPLVAEYVAQTQSSRQVSIQARVSGFLDRRVYTEGTLVKEGEVLFLMDRKPFQVQVDAAAANLARQQATLETTRANLARTGPLAEQNALSQKDLEDATGQFRAAEAAVEQARAQLAAEQLNLSYCTITSPVTGITGAAQQQDGTYISAQNSLLTTVSVLSPIWVTFSISEGEMQRVADAVARGTIIPPRNDEFEVEILLANGKPFSHRGRITFADPSFNPATGTFLLRASVANPDGTLRPNQHVKARILGATRPKAILVPQRAIQQGAKGSFVWVVDEHGEVEVHPVVPGGWHGDEWFIDQGLVPGDRVIVDGVLSVRPGEKVVAKPYAAQAPPAPKAAADARSPG